MLTPAFVLKQRLRALHDIRYGVSEWQVYLPEDVLAEHAEACNRILRGYQVLNEQYAPTMFLLLASGIFR